jgi:hypothetical protein
VDAEIARYERANLPLRKVYIGSLANALSTFVDNLGTQNKPSKDQTRAVDKLFGCVVQEIQLLGV